MIAEAERGIVAPAEFLDTSGPGVNDADCRCGIRLFARHSIAQRQAEGIVGILFECHFSIAVAFSVLIIKRHVPHFWRAWLVISYGVSFLLKLYKGAVNRLSL